MPSQGWLTLSARVKRAIVKSPILTLAGSVISMTDGFCPVCDSTHGFYLGGPNVREQLQCRNCRSTPRERHLVRVLCDETGASTLADYSPPQGGIYSASASGPLYTAMRGQSGCYFSEFHPGVAPGSALKQSTTVQNLERLTYGDDSFEIVVTEDVFEHVRDAAAGFREVHRVLRPGGRHIFTVPLNLDRPTLERVDTSGAEDVMLMEPEYHGDALTGRILAYRTFGYDLFTLLDSLGFATRLSLPSYSLRGQGIYDSLVLTSLKQ